MTHYSEVADNVFAQIKHRVRIIEPRLHDDAHRGISLGDSIIMVSRATRETLIARVVGVLRYPSFVELFHSYPPTHFGIESERQGLAEMRRYYTSDQEMTHGVIGLKLHVAVGGGV